MMERDEFDASPFMQGEVEEALNSIKPGKAVIKDGLPIEILEMLVRLGADLVTEIANSFYDTYEFPEQMVRSIFLTILMKPVEIDCDKIRAIQYTQKKKK